MEIKKKKGFTLIEVIAGVMIMGLVVLVTSGMFLTYEKIINNNRLVAENRSYYNLVYSKLMNLGYRKDIDVLNGEYLEDYNNYNEIQGLLLIGGKIQTLIGIESNSSGEATINIYKNVNEEELQDGYVLYGSCTPIGDNLENIKFESLKNNLVKVTMEIKTRGLDENYTFIIEGGNET